MENRVEKDFRPAVRPHTAFGSKIISAFLGMRFVAAEIIENKGRISAGKSRRRDQQLGFAPRGSFDSTECPLVKAGNGAKHSRMGLTAAKAGNPHRGVG